MIAFTIKTIASQTDNLSDQLMLLGAEALTWQDALNDPIYEPKPQEIILWPHIIITAHFAETSRASVSAFLETLKAQQLIHSFTTEEVIEQDWVRVSLDQFKPLVFGDRLCVCPSWDKPPLLPQGTTVFIDPGLAFGTGTHPTTALCLEWLAHNISGQESVIDYGCGSGLLGIAALKLGAQHVTCIDYDEQALEATRLNTHLNAFADKQIAIMQSPQQASPAVDLIIANILANTIIELREQFVHLLKPAGKLVVSGILREQCTAVITALASHFTLLDKTEKEEWICLVFAKFL